MNSLSKVVPAVLTDKVAEFEKLIGQAEKFTGYVQVDIMDGLFVPSHSITWKDIANVQIGISWEAHLMVLHPEEQFSGFKKVGARKVVFHYEATSEPEKAISEARKLGLEVGVAVNPPTTVSTILPLVDKVDSVLFLSVNPGFYGSPFLPEVLDKLPELRRARPNIRIGIDGGVKESNIAQIAGSGADDIFVGSAIFMQANPAQSFRRLSALAAQASKLRTR